jgi:hypothetical protein
MATLGPEQKHEYGTTVGEGGRCVCILCSVCGVPFIHAWSQGEYIVSRVSCLSLMQFSCLHVFMLANVDKCVE